MAIDLEKLYREQAVSGKYRKLYEYLCGLTESDWSVSFSEIETIIGFKLPPAGGRFTTPTSSQLCRRTGSVGC